MIRMTWFFSRWMALIYLAAFWSLGTQVLGLIGSHGILPVGDFLHYSQQSLHPFWAAPTLCWFNPSDAFLLFLCWGGAGLSILFLLGIMPGPIAFLLWVFYLSLTTGAQDFLGFQWDNLLLEAGFLLIFLVPRPLSIHYRPVARPSMGVVWLLRLLLFKLMLESGLVKLLSGDPNWANLTALTYHYWTQPLPNPISWYAAQLPLWFQKLSCIFLFIIELVMPFLIFAGRWARLVAFFGISGLQLLILLTGNYCFFNLLAIGLCLMLLEDEHLAFVPVIGKDIRPGGMVYKVLTGLVVAFVLAMNLGLLTLFFARLSVPRPLQRLMVAVSPLRSFNNYGLFAVMTTQRDEIILAGSDDGEHWLPYGFFYKPGDVDQIPKQAAPHQPRLDWQMWFASLGTWRDNPWLMSLEAKLLQGEPAVLKLLAVNPFQGHPPKYIRAEFWEYHFTDFKTRGPHGPWWQREYKGLYGPVVSIGPDSSKS